MLVSSGGDPHNTTPGDDDNAYNDSSNKKCHERVFENFFYHVCTGLREGGGRIDGCVADLERKEIHNNRVLKYLRFGKGQENFNLRKLYNRFYDAEA